MPRQKQPPPALEKPKRRPPGMGTVGVRANGRVFCVLPADLDPKRLPRYGPGRRQRFVDRDEAERWLDAEIGRLRNPNPKTATLTEPLGAYLVRWWTLYSPGWPARTASAYAAAIKLFASIAGVALGDLTHETVMVGISTLQGATWRRKKRQKGVWVPYGPSHPYAPVTIHQARAVLHQALGQLVPHILPFNPVTRARVARMQDAAQRVWDAEQAAQFEAKVRELRPDLYLAVRLILRRALRRGEVLSIKADDVDEVRRIVTIDETAGDRAGETGSTKGRRTRDIPLGELLVDVRDHRLQQATASDWLFPGRDSGKPLSMRHFTAIIDQIITAAGLPRITPKDMRATAASILLDENVALARVSRLLGHSNVAVTARFYERTLRITQSRVDHLAEDLDQAFARATETTRQAPPAALPGTPEPSKVSGKVSKRRTTR